MRLTVTHTVDREMLVWSTYRAAITLGFRPTKARVLRYLRTQLQLFGCDDLSLYGTDDRESIEWERAEAFVAEAFGEI
jgi:hypothetical protein